MTEGKMDDFDGHTPGPWTCVHNSWEVSTVYADGHEVARCYISPDVTEETQDALEPIKDANARLIAAAPDLLAERDRLRVANEWLREALLNIADMPANPAYDWYELVEEMASTARRAALAEKEGGE